MGRTIIFDCDDVLLNWQAGFMHWMAAIHRRPLDPAGPQSWDMQAWIGPDAFDMVARFNASQTFANLQPCAGAREAVKALYAAGHNLHVITSCSDDPTIVARRERNLDAIFGDVFTSITCLPLGASKKMALATLENHSGDRPIFIEDNVKHAWDAFDLDFRIFVMRRNHNRKLEYGANSILDWIDDFAPLLDLVSENDLMDAT